MGHAANMVEMQNCENFIGKPQGNIWVGRSKYRFDDFKFSFIEIRSEDGK
jgi:hypothetical protein